MPLPTKAISGVVLLLALALAGCGRSGATTATTSASDKPPAATVISFTSPVVHGESLPAQYTCDGKNIHPPLAWGTVPTDASELFLLVVGLTPTSTAGNYRASVEWAVAGINPGLHRLAAGQLPASAHVGTASDGKRAYSICPQKGVAEHYQFALYALPSTLKISPNFSGLTAFSQLSNANTATAPAGEGEFLLSYKRR
jgi:phosphatidylethanolamine-binding protein (PEBP) family uncharacterized protein